MERRRRWRRRTTPPRVRGGVAGHAPQRRTSPPFPVGNDGAGLALESARASGAVDRARCPTTICCTPRCSWRFCSRSCGPVTVRCWPTQEGHRKADWRSCTLWIARLHPGSHGDQPPGDRKPACDCWACGTPISSGRHDSHGVHPRHQLRRVATCLVVEGRRRGLGGRGRGRGEGDAARTASSRREGRFFRSPRRLFGRSSPRRRRRFGSPPSRSTDSGGAYGVLLLGLCIVGDRLLFAQPRAPRTLGLRAHRAHAESPEGRDETARDGARSSASRANLAARYAFGAYPLARSLGLSEPAQRFLHRTVGLAPNLPRNELMSQLLGPSALVIVTHFHRVGALSSASFGGEVGGGFGVGSSGSGGRPVPLPVASNQTGVFPFLRRVAVLHSGRFSPSPRCISACDTWTCSARRCSRAPARSASRPRRRQRRPATSESPSPRRLPITPLPCAGFTTRR